VGKDALGATSAAETIDVLAGNDFVIAWSGKDVVYGRKGNDIIRALDLFRDRIDCGTGNSDTVVYDRNLDTIEDCEIKRPFN
jgi:Ca2+-binding RTX toxin-like protein